MQKINNILLVVLITAVNLVTNEALAESRISVIRIGARYITSIDGVSQGRQRAPFGSGGGCSLQTNVNSPWPPGTYLKAIRSFELPLGARKLIVQVAIDNDVQVLVNGQDISGGLVTHEGCPNRFDFSFKEPDSILLEGTNMLEVRARDRGGETYLDTRVRVTIP